MTYVLYLNLWGTTAKLPRAAVPACQTKFLEIVGRDFALVEAQCLFDYAYAVSTDLEALIEFARDCFRKLIFASESGEIWPLRGAISEDVYQANHVGGKPSWIGLGAVVAAEIEKSALKGARLFVDGGIRTHVPSSRDLMVRGVRHREINWMEGWLDEGRRQKLRSVCAELMDAETNYSQQLAAPIRDLTDWTSDGSSGEIPKGESPVSR